MKMSVVKITLPLLCTALAATAVLHYRTLPVRADETPSESLESFPKSSLVIESGPRLHSFEVWIADTAAHRAQGLMFVRHLPNDKGMLFVFDRAEPVVMWMKNTFIPLDMLFIDADGRIIRIAERTRPHSLETIGSLGAVTAVLEIAGGECARLGIEAGARVRHAAFDTN